MKQKNTKVELPIGHTVAILKQHISISSISMYCQFRTVLFAGSIRDRLELDFF